MRRITIQYHQEHDSWWAESPDVPGFTSAASDFNSLRNQTIAALQEVIEGPFVIFEDNRIRRLPEPADTANLEPRVTLSDAVPA